MANVKLHLDTRSKKKDGTYPVKIYVSVGRGVLIPTEISVPLEMWTGNEKKPTGQRIYDLTLLSMLTQARVVVFRLLADGKLRTMSVKDIKAEILKCYKLETEDNESADLLRLIFEEFTSTREAEGTKSIYRQTLAKIGSYYNLNSLKVSDVTLQWLRGFEGKMRASDLSINSVGVHMRNLRAVINRAIDDELISSYPFRKFKIKTEKTIKRSLKVDQLRMLRDYKCEPHQERYRDLFMLIFYLIGINIVDLANIKSIENGRVIFKRAKTKALYSIKIEPEALAVIEKYKGDNFLINIGDKYTNYKDFLRRINRGLQSIGTVTMVDNAAKDPKKVKKNKKSITPQFKNITTYWARHTWATIAAELDITDETISLALGHSSGNKVTNIYIDRNQKKVDAANRKVIDFVNGK